MPASFFHSNLHVAIAELSRQMDGDTVRMSFLPPLMAGSDHQWFQDEHIFHDWVLPLPHIN